jgi:hypothetical protein
MSVDLHDGSANFIAFPHERVPREPAHPFDQCIYCNATESEDVKLTNEHIIPDGLGGDLFLPNASCSKCARDINSFEQKAMKTWFGMQRELLGLTSRKKRKRGYVSQNEIAIIEQNVSDSALQDIAKKNLPFPKTGKISDLVNKSGIYPASPLPPGALHGRPINEFIKWSPIIVVEHVPGRASTLGFRTNLKVFTRLIAKIAYCYAQLFTMKNDIKFTIVDFIKGNDSSSDSYWIGDSVFDLEPGPRHVIGVELRTTYTSSSSKIDFPKAVVVTVGLFVSDGAPVYDVVVGYL